MIIRPETEHDYAAIREINLQAFAHHPYSQQTEHLIVEALRAQFALSLSLVAEADGHVVGHVAFSPVTIGGEFVGWYALGPLAVLPEKQRRGIGSQLVLEGLRQLRALGAAGCVLVGEPAYYTRFGFQHDPGLTMEGVPPEVILSLTLSGATPQGNVEHHPSFWVKAEVPTSK